MGIRDIILTIELSNYVNNMKRNTNKRLIAFDGAVMNGARELVGV
jgi:hypothetical protein